MAIAAALAAGGPLVAPAGADHGPLYKGSYANSIVSGTTVDGRDVAVMSGVHDDFPHHHPNGDYDQLAVLVGGEPVAVVTGRPVLAGLTFDLDDTGLHVAYSGGRVALDLELAGVRHPDRYEGDPANAGDAALRAGVSHPDSPGLVYTPYELTGLLRGTLTLDGEDVPLAGLQGQAEAGRLHAPSDERFLTGYDYLAAPALPGPGCSQYTYLAFDTRSLHGNPAGTAYLSRTASDRFTMQGGTLVDGNARGAPEPFDNRGELPAGATSLAAWEVDLGFAILHRRLVRLRDAGGCPLLALSETIVEKH